VVVINMYLDSGAGTPSGGTIQPLFQAGMRALVIYHSINTSTDSQKKKRGSEYWHGCTFGSQRGRYDRQDKGAGTNTHVADLTYLMGVRRTSGMHVFNC